MRIQTTLNDKLKNHSSHHTLIADWGLHDCVEWDDCNILIQKFEQKKQVAMKKETFDFSEALKRMRKGKLVKRENGLYPFGIDEEGIFYHYGHHIFKVESMSSEDILATDWKEV